MPDLIDRLARSAAGRSGARAPVVRVPDAPPAAAGATRGFSLPGFTRRGALAGGGAVMLALGLGVRPRGAWAQGPCQEGQHFCQDPQSGHCCNASNACCGDQGLGHPCCAPGYACCRGILCCPPGQDCCVGFLPRLGVHGGSCCPPGVGCGTFPDGSPCCLDHPDCCGGWRKCEHFCCEEGHFCCDPQGIGCCPDGDACCPVGPPNQEVYECCAKPAECLRQIVGDNVGITRDSPMVCCPPERITRITASPMCCPPHKVKMPGDVLRTRGSGTCCNVDKVCGDDCCDSLPSFPMHCVSGRCEFDWVKIDEIDAQARRGGDVPVRMRFKRPAKGTVALRPAGTASSAAAAADAGPVLGRARFRVRKPGRRDVEVRLNRRGRRMLAARRKLAVEAVITFREDGQHVSSFTPMTIERARRRRP